MNIGNVVGEDYQKSIELDSKDYSWNHSIYMYLKFVRLKTELCRSEIRIGLQGS